MHDINLNNISNYHPQQEVEWKCKSLSSLDKKTTSLTQQEVPPLNNRVQVQQLFQPKGLPSLADVVA